ncbi:MAG: histone deacetylase, partial [Syntrophomonadaceae bacterium]|nr:histone deacetylase [Syntrophomonadaceae bacterium]
AVLEGGYSVQTALPYVNMGLIMAMAGIDYSNLREPDYVPERMRENPANLEYIEKMVRRQLQVFRQREEQIAKNRKTRERFHHIHKQIFYDTDYIHEDQSIQLRLCPECPGFRLIESTAQHRNGYYYRVYCVSIPANACASCQAEGHSCYTDMSGNDRYDLVYLQDRVNDNYRSIDIKKDMEMVL